MVRSCDGWLTIVERSTWPWRNPVELARAAGYEPDDWQQRYLLSDAPQVLLNIGRQMGKSTATATLALWTALTQPHSLVLLVSPGERQSGEIFTKLEQQYAAVGKPVKAEKHTELQLELANGSRVVALPGKEATIRSFSGVRLLVLDEAARVPDELYYAVRPMLAVSRGRLVALSTPFGKRGWWWDAWGAEHPADGLAAGFWECYEVAATQCPRYSADWLERERLSMPMAWFESEYMCRFVDAIDQLFGYDLIQRALTDADEAAPLALDWSL